MTKLDVILVAYSLEGFTAQNWLVVCPETPHNEMSFLILGRTEGDSTLLADLSYEVFDGLRSFAFLFQCLSVRKPALVANKQENPRFVRVGSRTYLTEEIGCEKK